MNIFIKKNKILAIVYPTTAQTETNYISLARFLFDGFSPLLDTEPEEEDGESKVDYSHYQDGKHVRKPHVALNIAEFSEHS